MHVSCSKGLEVWDGSVLQAWHIRVRAIRCMRVYRILRILLLGYLEILEFAT